MQEIGITVKTGEMLTRQPLKYAKYHFFNLPAYTQTVTISYLDINYLPM